MTSVPYPSDGRCWGCNKQRRLRWIAVPLLPREPDGAQIGVWNCRACEENERVLRAHAVQSRMEAR